MQKSNDAIHQVVCNPNFSDSIWSLIEVFKKYYQTFTEMTFEIGDTNQALQLFKLFNYFNDAPLPKVIDGQILGGGFGWFYGGENGNPTHFIIPKGNVDSSLINSAVILGEDCVILGVDWSMIIIDLRHNKPSGITYTTIDFTRKYLIEGKILPLIHADFKPVKVKKKTYHKLNEIMMKIHQWKTIPQEKRILMQELFTQTNEYIQYTQGLIHNLTMGGFINISAKDNLDFDLKQCILDIIEGGLVDNPDLGKFILLLHSITLELVELQEMTFFHTPLNFSNFNYSSSNEGESNPYMEITPNTFC